MTWRTASSVPAGARISGFLSRPMLISFCIKQVFLDLSCHRVLLPPEEVVRLVKDDNPCRRSDGPTKGGHLLFGIQKVVCPDQVEAGFVAIRQKGERDLAQRRSDRDHLLYAVLPAREEHARGRPER